MALSPGSTKPADVAPADRLDTLEPWPWDVLDPEAPRTLGWHCIAWAEGPSAWSGFPGLYDRRGQLDGWRGLVQPNGPRARKPFRLTQRQRRFWLWFYALDEGALWEYSGGVRRLAKGSGKSPFAAGHSLLEFVGPCRLDRFDDRMPGGCRVRPVDMPVVHIAATAETQTHNTMRMVRAFAPKGGHLVGYYHLDPGKTIYYGVPERTLQVITSSVTSADGGEETFVVKDEQEHWTPSNSGPALDETLDDNLAKSGARSLGTSNAWKPGAESVAETDWDAWVAQEEGRLKDDAGKVLYDAVVAPPDTDMSDPGSLRTALELVYADCDWKHPGGVRTETSKPDVRSVMKRIWSPRATPTESERKYLNRPASAEDAWTTKEAWALLVDASRVVADGEEVALFFDGSKSRDATALIGCCISDGHVFAVGVWEPDPRHDTVSIVPVGQVDLTVRKALSRWRVLGFFADVNEWESFAKVSWPELATDLLVKAVPGGEVPLPIAWDMRNSRHAREFTAAAELTLDEIESVAFTHDGSSALGRHVVNCRQRENRWGTTVGKESRDSPKKIDAGVCMIGARMVRQRVLAARPEPPRSKAVRRL